MQNCKDKRMGILATIIKFVSNEIVLSILTALLNITFMFIYCKLCLIHDGNENDTIAITQVLADAVFPTTSSLLLSCFIQIMLHTTRNKVFKYITSTICLLISIVYIFFWPFYRELAAASLVFVFIVVSLSLCIASLIVPSLLTVPPQKQLQPISPAPYFSPSIEWALKNSIIEKNVPLTCLQHNCKLKQALTFLWKAIEYPKPISSKPYKKLTKEDMYDKSLAWAKEKNIYCSDKSKKGQASMPCTFTMIIQILWTLKERPSIDIDDEINVPSENSKAISWALKNDIIEQSFLDDYSLNQPCTIGQVLYILHRFFAKLPE